MSFPLLQESRHVDTRTELRVVYTIKEITTDTQLKKKKKLSDETHNTSLLRDWTSDPRETPGKNDRWILFNWLTKIFLFRPKVYFFFRRELKGVDDTTCYHLSQVKFSRSKRSWTSLFGGWSRVITDSWKRSLWTSIIRLRSDEKTGHP